MSTTSVRPDDSRQSDVAQAQRTPWGKILAGGLAGALLGCAVTGAVLTYRSAQPAPSSQPSPTVLDDAATNYPGVPVIAVSLNGPGFFTRATQEADIRRGKGLPAAADSVVDGRFLDRFQQWDEGPVWWEASSPDAVPGTWIQIDLAGPRTIGSVTVQADNNDSYLLTYRNPSSGDWKDLWVVPPEYAFGMVTRPNQFDDGDRHVLPTPVTTDAVRIAAQEGDGMYAVSEVQLFVQE